jgi:hypothetical protein
MHLSDHLLTRVTVLPSKPLVTKLTVCSGGKRGTLNICVLWVSLLVGQCFTDAQQTPVRPPVECMLNYDNAEVYTFPSLAERITLS